MKNSLKLLCLLWIFVVCNSTQAVTVAPKITNVSVTPTSAKAGTMFKFTATLTAPLATGNKVKIDVGNKILTTMAGNGIKYTFSQTIYTAGKSTYKVGIYDAKGVLQSSISSGSYTVTSTSSVNHAPTLSLVSADEIAKIGIPPSCPTGTNKIICDASVTFYNALSNYGVTLNAKDVDANLSSITMNWGDSTPPDTLVATDSNDLIFHHNYKTAGTFVWSAFAADKGAPALNSNQISKTISVTDQTAIANNPNLLPETGYSKVCNSGSYEGQGSCPTDPKLGTGTNQWGCTRDNETGLIWELKTTDGSLRDIYNTYSWYEPDPNKNQGNSGSKNGGKCKGSDCDTYAYTNAVNKQGLCGSKDWRMPTKDELVKLIVCSNDSFRDDPVVARCSPVYSNTLIRPTIDSTYFPNTRSGWYWTVSPYPEAPKAALSLDFGSGSGSGNTYYGKQDVHGVRLVRGIAKSISPTDCANGQILNSSQTACIDKPVTPSNTSSSKCDLPFTSLTSSEINACSSKPCSQWNQFNQAACSSIILPLF